MTARVERTMALKHGGMHRDVAHSAAPIAILAPAGRDGAVAATVIARAGLTPQVCGDMDAFCEAIRDEVGVLVLAEEALAGPARDALLVALGDQPTWSDVPVVVLTGEGELSRTLSPTLLAVTERANVTLLERPVRVATLVTALRSALRARGRQFDVRDHLAERRAAEAALQIARVEAEAANRAKGEFLAVMSHELRTPLNAIGGYAELLELGIHGPITAEQRMALDRIQRSQRHLLGLINGVLNYARVEAGAVHYELRDVPLGDVLATCEALTAPQVRSKGLTFTMEACDASIRVRADAEKVQQIVLNILSNAIKFTRAGGWISLRCVAPAVRGEVAADRGDAGAAGSRAGAADMISVEVSDSGIGIDAEALAKVFEPFVQVDARLTRTHEGTGLGLAISRDLARGMGGDLTARSTFGVGSTFTLTLPLA